MGLTIYYELGMEAGSSNDAIERLEALRSAATRLPFERVGEVSFSDEIATAELIRAGAEGPGPAAFELVESSCYAQNEELRGALGEGRLHSVEPECFARFTVYPGEGSETAVFGLSRFPATTPYNGRQWPTGLKRWHWHSWCKTQYASNPRYGGVDHFLKVHLSLIELLDRAQELGILIRVGDDSNYWEDRDRQKLIDNVNKLNGIVASFAGALKDAIDRKSTGQLQADQLRAPITDFPNFEHIEADHHRRSEEPPGFFQE